MKHKRTKDAVFTEVVEEVTEEVVNEVVEEVVNEVVEEVVNEVVEEPVETENEAIPSVVDAVLNTAKCKKLNVRKEAIKDSEIVHILNEKSLFNVDLDKSTEDFYHIKMLDPAISGYCLKEFINIK